MPASGLCALDEPGRRDLFGGTIMTRAHSVILIDPEEQSRDVLIERLRMQGYQAKGFAGPVEGAHAALGSPPSAVVADLWMAGISGVQLTRLLRAEPATERVPVILRGPDGPRNRFWSERAGAAAYVVKGRMVELVRALGRCVVPVANQEEEFFTQLQDAESALRDRIAACLDAALFESVLAAEVRALSTCGTFDRLFDRLTQFVSQVMSYRWLALLVHRPAHLGLHAHPTARGECEQEVRQALDLPADTVVLRIEDEEASAARASAPPLVRPIEFGQEIIAHIALSQKGVGDREDTRVLDVIARELGGPMRMTLLVEETQRAATTDPLTGLMNRRAFLAALDVEQSRSERHGYPMSLLMLDIDHFKLINDEHGHAMGDQVLVVFARMLAQQARKTDIVGRWGGEEFVIVLSGANEAGARLVGERIRRATEGMAVLNDRRQPVSVTVSIGIACLEVNDTLDGLIERADRAMYQAKASGRNRVTVAPTVLRRTGTIEIVP
jgi:two-component system cell cycle response regulator